MLKEKKCKGLGIALGYGCGELVPVSLYGKPNRKYGLGKKPCGCYQKWLLNSDTGKEILSKTITKVKEPRIELEKAFEENKKNKSLSYLIQNTVNICHEYIRLRDKYKPCISCGEPWHDDFQACHLYPAGKYSSLKFDEMNISGGCRGCNLFEEGNESGYRVGFIKRYSKGQLDLLDSKALLEKKQGFKWDRIKLKEIQNYYKQKLKDLQNAK